MRVPKLRRIPEGLPVTVLAPVLVFCEGLLGRRVFTSGDGLATYLPWYRTAARAWRDLSLPAWNPTSFAGSPLLGLSQAGVYYPPNWLHVFLPPVMASNLDIVAQFLIAGVGAWLLARRLTGDGAAAGVAGVAFALSGFMFGHIGHTAMIASAAWLPWLFYGYELLRERITPWRALVGGGSIAMSFFAGHSQLAFTGLLALGLYAATATVLARRGERGRCLLAGAVLGVVGVGLAAAQLVPTAAFLPDTDRAHFPYEQAMSYSMPGSHTPLLVFPYLFGNQNLDGPVAHGYTGKWNLTEMAGYPGAAALVLAAAGFAAARRDRRIIALAVSAAVTLALALGPTTPLSHWAFDVPIYGQFRSWARYVVVLDLVVACLAAYGVQALRSADRGTRRVALALAGLTAGALVVAAVVVPRLDSVKPFLPPGGVRRAAVLFPCGFAVAAALAGFWLRRSRRVAAVAVALIAGFDAVLSFGLFYEWRTGAPTAASVRHDEQSKSVTWGGVVDQPGGIDRYLFVGAAIQPMGYDFVGYTDYKGLNSANGSGPLAPRDYLEATGMNQVGAVVVPARLWAKNAQVLDLLRITTVVSHPISAFGGAPPDSVLQRGQPLVGWDDSPVVRYEHRPRLPEAFIVGRVERRPRDQVLAALWGKEPFDPAATALVESPCRQCPNDGSPGRAGEVQRTRWSPTGASVRIDLRADRPGLLVLSQSWARGWRATVDGRSAPVVRVDGLTQGVPVPPGDHHVRLRYVAPGAGSGLALSGLTLGALGAWAFVRRRRKPDRTINLVDDVHLVGDVVIDGSGEGQGLKVR